MTAMATEVAVSSPMPPVHQNAGSQRLASAVPKPDSGSHSLLAPPVATADPSSPTPPMANAFLLISVTPASVGLPAPAPASGAEPSPPPLGAIPSEPKFTTSATLADTQASSQQAPLVASGVTPFVHALDAIAAPSNPTPPGKATPTATVMPPRHALPPEDVEIAGTKPKVLTADPSNTTAPAFTSSTEAAPRLVSVPAEPGQSNASPPPAVQVVPVLIHLASAEAGGQVTLQVSPAALGQIDIRIDRPADGPVQVAISVHRPETLALLQSDRHQLIEALDRGGLKSTDRIVTLQLAAARDEPAIRPTATASPHKDDFRPGAHRQPDPPAQPTQTPPGTMSSAAGDNSSGQPGRETMRQRVTSQPPADIRESNDSSPLAPEPLPTAKVWMQVGIDITA